MKKRLFFIVIGIVFMTTTIFCGVAYANNDKEYYISNTELTFYLNDINSKIDKLYDSMGITSLSLNSFKLLKDLDSQEYNFISLDFFPYGYAIYHRKTGSILERNPVGNSPYINLGKELEAYYSGINSYFYKINDTYYNVSDESILSISNLTLMKEKIIKIKAEDIKVSNNEKRALRLNPNIKAEGSGEDTIIYYGDVKSLYFPFLNDRFASLPNDRLFGLNATTLPGGTCGQVAAGMLLQFYSRNGIKNFVPNGYFTSENAKNLNQAYLFDEEINIYAEDKYMAYYRDVYDLNLNALPHSSYSKLKLNSEAENLHQFLRLCSDPFLETVMPSKKIKEAINGYFEILQFAGVPLETATAISTVVNVGSFVKQAINSNNPAILVTLSNNGEYVDYDGNWQTTSNAGYHAMVVYGYTSTLLFSPNEYICHGGWSDSANASYSTLYVNRVAVEGAVKLVF